MSAPAAPAPWDWDSAAKPNGRHAGFNLYVTDANGRKIAAVWGKAEEKEATLSLIVAAPYMLAALELCVNGAFPDERGDYPPGIEVACDAIAKAKKGIAPCEPEQQS